MGAFVAFVDIAYGLTGPVAGLVAGQFGSRFDTFMYCSANMARPYQDGYEGDVFCVAEPNWTERIPRPP